MKIVKKYGMYYLDDDWRYEYGDYEYDECWESIAMRSRSYIIFQKM